MSRFQHPSYYSRRNRIAKAEDERSAAPESDAGYDPSLRYSQQACCCPAPPAVIAVITSADSSRAPAELFLCGHHYRQSRRALADCGATLLDLAGQPLTSDTWPEPAPR
jgi:hypothetical protein